MSRWMLAFLWLGSAAFPAAAQGPTASTRTVEALGLETRVVTLGLEDRRPGEPVLLLMAYVGVEWDLPADYRSWIDTEHYDQVTRLGIEFAVDRFATRPDATVLIASESNHDVFRDVPDLCLMAVRRVLTAVEDGG